MKCLEAYGKQDMDDKMQAFVDNNYIPDDTQKWREDKGSYDGHPALFMCRGDNTICVVYDVLHQANKTITK